MTKYKRLKDLSRTVWSLLTKEEKEYYLSGDGPMLFIADISRILNVEVPDLLSELFDEILEQL